MIRIGIVGCGSVVQQYHLPAIQASGEFCLTGIADVNPGARKSINARWPVAQKVDDYRELENLDAVLVASPHSLHAEMCAHFLDRSVHVLVEKPMVIDFGDAGKLVELARLRGAVFAVGVFRRYYPVSRLVRALIDNDWCGGVVEIDAEEGGIYDWELQSRFLLDRSMAGGGVLMDTGSHLLDRILWWFPDATVNLQSYHDDSASGVEADCEICFHLKWRDREIACRAAMSRIRTLRNTLRFKLRDGWLELGANEALGFSWGSVALDAAFGGEKVWMQAGQSTADPSPPLGHFLNQINDFAFAIRTGSPTLNNAASNLATVQLIAECYAIRRSLPKPWLEPKETLGLP